nr:hypothetical protein [Microbacterium hominis]
MKLKLGLRRGAGAAVDVLITADATATVEDVARAVAAGDALASAGAVNAGGVPTLQVAPPAGHPVQLDPRALIAEAPIGSGFDAAVVPAPAGAAGGGATAAIMQIHSGPEAGRTVALPAGASVIGRVAPRRSCSTIPSSPSATRAWRSTRASSSSTSTPPTAWSSTGDWSSASG